MVVKVSGGCIVMYGGGGGDGVIVCPEHDKHLSKNTSLPPLFFSVLSADGGS